MPETGAQANTAKRVGLNWWALIPDIPGWIALVHEILQKKVRAISNDDYRKAAAQMMIVLRKASLSHAEIIEGRLRRASETGEPALENTVVTCIGRVMPIGNDGKLDEAKAVEIGKIIAEMSEDAFDTFIELSQHDPFIQILKYLFGDLDRERLSDLVAYVAAALYDFGGNVEKFLESVAARSVGERDIKRANRKLVSIYMKLDREIEDEREAGWWTILYRG